MKQLPFRCYIHIFVENSDERIRMIMFLKKYPLLLFAAKMVITVLNIQFDSYTIIHCNYNIVQRCNIY